MSNEDNIITKSAELKEAIRSFLTSTTTDGTHVTIADMISAIPYAPASGGSAHKTFSALCSRLSREMQYLHRIKVPGPANKLGRPRPVLAFTVDYSRPNPIYGKSRISKPGKTVNLAAQAYKEGDIVKLGDALLQCVGSTATAFGKFAVTKAKSASLCLEDAKKAVQTLNAYLDTIPSDQQFEMWIEDKTLRARHSFVQSTEF